MPQYIFVIELVFLMQWVFNIFIANFEQILYNLVFPLLTLNK